MKPVLPHAGGVLALCKGIKNPLGVFLVALFRLICMKRTLRAGQSESSRGKHGFERGRGQNTLTVLEQRFGIDRRDARFHFRW